MMDWSAQAPELGIGDAPTQPQDSSSWKVIAPAGRPSSNQTTSPQQTGRVPSQLPATGMPLATPNGTTRSAAPLVFVLRRRNVDPSSVYTPTVVFPSPF